MTLERVIEMLEDVKDGIDYETETGLIDNELLDSFDILQIISAIDDEFEVAVPASEIVPANFNSAQAIFDMIARLAE